ncbi:MAG: glycosyltransferase [Planctomycetota bacterium]
MQPIRICQLVTELRPGGAERCVYELATRLDREKFDVQVAALRGGAVAEELRSAGVKVHVLDVGGKWSLALPGKLRRLAAMLRDEGIELLHTHLFHADLAGRLAMRKGGVRHLVHTVHVAEKRWRPWQFAFARWMKRRCERIVCVSPSVKQWHAQQSGLADDCYEVIANGIDADAFARDEAARRKLREDWRAGDEDVVAAFVGRLDRQKGADVLLATIERLAGEGQRIKFVIAGDGPQRPMVEQFCSTQAGEACQYLGHVGNVNAVLSAADMFILPSRWEGWPLALGEAMAAGLACVGTEVAGIQDVLTDGQTGLVVDGENPEQLAAAVGRLAADAALREYLGGCASELIGGEFSIEANVKRHEELYLRVTGGGAT